MMADTENLTAVGGWLLDLADDIETGPGAGRDPDVYERLRLIVERVRELEEQVSGGGPINLYRCSKQCGAEVQRRVHLSTGDCKCGGRMRLVHIKELGE